MIFKSLEGFDVDAEFGSSFEEDDSDSSISDKSESKPSFHAQPGEQ